MIRDTHRILTNSPRILRPELRLSRPDWPRTWSAGEGELEKKKNTIYNPIIIIPYYTILYHHIYIYTYIYPIIPQCGAPQL